MDDLFSWVVSRRRLVGRLGAAGLAYGVLPPGAAACALGAGRCGPCWDGIAPCNGYPHPHWKTGFIGRTRSFPI
jgi:hypothetical protein